MTRVLLGGEGRSELGGWANKPPYRAAEPDSGVLEALLRRVRPDGLSVVDGIRWKDIRKFKVGAHRTAEERNVLGLALLARELSADVVAFTRDRDGDRRRERDVAEGIERAETLFPNVHVVGGVAVEMIEAWILGLRGRKRAEKLGNPKPETARFGLTSVEAFVQLVRDAKLEEIPKDAASLRGWLARATEALTPEHR